MKLISTQLNPRYHGIVNAAIKIFDMVRVWEPKEKPVYDMFEDVKPDILFCDMAYINPVFIQACNEYLPQIVLFNNMAPEGLNPKVICAEPDISSVLKKNIGENALFISDYADIATYWDGEYKDDVSSDICYVSKFKNDITEQIMTFSSLRHLGKLKIAGPVKIPLSEFLGTIRPEKEIEFMRSSKISIDWGGTNLLNQAANGIFTLSTIPNRLFPTLDKTNEQITSFLGNDGARQKIARKAQKKVLKDDTCYHRLYEIFRKLDIDGKEYYDLLNKCQEIECKAE